MLFAASSQQHNAINDTQNAVGTKLKILFWGTSKVGNQQVSVPFFQHPAARERTRSTIVLGLEELEVAGL